MAGARVKPHELSSQNPLGVNMGVSQVTLNPIHQRAWLAKTFWPQDTSFMELDLGLGLTPDSLAQEFLQGRSTLQATGSSTFGHSLKPTGYR